MAKVEAMPSRAVIDGLRGKIDFYRWNGIACVRKWPRFKPTSMTEASKAHQPAFRYISQSTPLLSSEVVESWRWLADQSNLTWRDWLTRAYLGATLAAPKEPWP